jgi:serine/threonine protein kinase
MAEQCKDLAFALSLIHNGQQNNTTSITMESEPVYGRHGDIKPSNILWFADNIDGFDDKGSLVLSDFGLVSNHSHESRSNSAASRVPVSPTYRAPESDMGGKISRSYDIWSLGCTFLDFVTWYLLGWEGVLQFAEERVENDDHFGLTTDTFFHMKKKKKKHQPVVKRQVVRWVQSLHRNQQCTEYLHDFLAIIMEEMLVVDPAHRIRSQELTAALEKIWKSCLEKEEYYTKHVPRKK